LLIELKMQDFPLDECLKVCTKYNVKEAQAYLLERLGAIHQALDLYAQVRH
jgi:hypothetical protein